jgi:cytochrome c biogenesis protein
LSAVLLGLISDLRLAIALLLVIALASGIGTAIPQLETADFYHDRYDRQPWLGILDGDGVLQLQLDHVYSSGWFLLLLAWLGLSLLLCSWRRQWPALRASLSWITYRSPRQLSKLTVAETRSCQHPERALGQLAQRLRGEAGRCDGKRVRCISPPAAEWWAVWVPSWFTPEWCC